MGDNACLDVSQRMPGKRGEFEDVDKKTLYKPHQHGEKTH